MFQGNGSMNMLDVEYPKSLKVSNERIYQILIRAKYDAMIFCKHPNQKGHFVSQCKGFHKNIMQMMNRGLFRVETIMDDEVSMIDMLGRELYWVQFTPKGPPKLIFSKPKVVHK